MTPLQFFFPLSLMVGCLSVAVAGHGENQESFMALLFKKGGSTPIVDNSSIGLFQVSVFAFLLLFMLSYATKTIINRLLRKKFQAPSVGGSILITGTSTGIGRATCQYLAQQYPNHTFYCGVRKLKDAPTTELPYSLPNVKPIILDITKEDQIKAALSTIESDDTSGPLVGLINNAGVHKLGSVEFMSESDFRWVFDVNVFGTYKLTQAALPLLRQSKGRVLTIGSISGRVPGVPRTAAYQASKYALEPFMDALRQEVSPHGVSVSMLEPGFLASEITQQLDLGCDQIKQESLVYPDLVSKRHQTLDAEIYGGCCGRMIETLQAVEDALMSPYPQTRYMTASVCGLPSSMFYRMAQLMPDRLFDLSMEPQYMEHLLLIQRIRNFVGF